MICLTLDTALAACTVGIVANEKLLVHKQELRARGHAERLVPMVQEALAEAGHPAIQCIITTLGPGSFTGLRVGLSAAQAFGLAWNCPVLGVSTLHAVAFAHAAKCAQKMLIAHDAGRGQYYAQLFDETAAPLADFFAAPRDEILARAEAAQAQIIGADFSATDGYPTPFAMAGLAAAGRAHANLAPNYGAGWGTAAA